MKEREKERKRERKKERKKEEKEGKRKRLRKTSFEVHVPCATGTAAGSRHFKKHGLRVQSRERIILAHVINANKVLALYVFLFWF